MAEITRASVGPVMGGIPFDMLFGGQGKMGAMPLFGVVGNIGGVIRLLSAEIPRRHADHHQPARAETGP